MNFQGRTAPRNPFLTMKTIISGSTGRFEFRQSQRRSNGRLGMLDYRGGANNDSDPTPSLRNGSENRKFAPSEAWRLAWRRKGMILTLAILGALLGFVATKTLTPRYVATAQIYLDPHGLPGLEKEDSASHEDFDRLHKLRRDPGENSYLPRRAGARRNQGKTRDRSRIRRRRRLVEHAIWTPAFFGGRLRGRAQRRANSRSAHRDPSSRTHIHHRDLGDEQQPRKGGPNRERRRSSV